MAVIIKSENIPNSQSQATKALVAAAGPHGLVTLAIWTHQKSLVWGEIEPVPAQPANLCRINFGNCPTAITINRATASATCLDVLVGFPTGDLFWLDLIGGKYNRLNKSGCVSASPITALAWCPPVVNDPSSALVCMSAHADGCIIIWCQSMCCV